MKSLPACLPPCLPASLPARPPAFCWKQQAQCGIGRKKSCSYHYFLPLFSSRFHAISADLHKVHIQAHFHPTHYGVLPPFPPACHGFLLPQSSFPSSLQPCFPATTTSRPASCWSAAGSATRRSAPRPSPRSTRWSRQVG